MDASHVQRDRVFRFKVLSYYISYDGRHGYDGLAYQNCAQTKFVRNRHNVNRHNPITYVIGYFCRGKKRV